MNFLPDDDERRRLFEQIRKAMESSFGSLGSTEALNKLARAMQPSQEELRKIAEGLAAPLENAQRQLAAMLDPLQAQFEAANRSMLDSLSKAFAGFAAAWDESLPHELAGARRR